MAGLGIGKQIAGQVADDLLGTIEKATLTIIDGRYTVVSETYDPVEANTTAPVSTASDAVQRAVTMKAGIRSEFADVSELLRGSNMKVFAVQFNPSELSFHAMGGGIVQKMNYGKSEKKTGKKNQKDDSLSFEAMTTRITMEVDLIFDRVNPKDAFTQDKLSGSLTGAATGIAQLGMKMAGKLDYSVQTEVEGLTAALRNSYSREVIFTWGSMSYKGILNRVAAEYTMFNTVGQPIRARVHLSIVLADEAVNPEMLGPWEESYQQAFSEDKSLVRAGQMVGNLLNLNI